VVEEHSKEESVSKAVLPGPRRWLLEAELLHPLDPQARGASLRLHCSLQRQRLRLSSALAAEMPLVEATPPLLRPLATQRPWVLRPLLLVCQAVLCS